MRVTICLFLVVWVSPLIAVYCWPQRFAERLPAKTLPLPCSRRTWPRRAPRFKRRGWAKAQGPTFSPFIAELTKRDLATPLHMRPAFGFDWSDLAATHDTGGIAFFPLADGTLGGAWIFTPEKIEPLKARLHRGGDGLLFRKR